MADQMITNSDKVFATCPRHARGSKTFSVENIQSLNAAYTIVPSYSNNFEAAGRSKTLGRLTSHSLARGTSPHRNKKYSSVVASSPDLSLLASNYCVNSTLLDVPNMSLAQHKTETGNRAGSSAGSTFLRVNGEGEKKSSSRNSGGDFILQLQQENDALKREIDVKESKLQSNMNSIKTFWSPELKKERTLRKEETLRVTTLREQLKVTQEENQHAQLTMQALQDELRAQRDLNQLLQDDFTSSHRQDGGFSGISSLSGESRLLQDDNDRLTRDNELLQRTLEEMEARIEAQRQTLDTRDESVRKLLEMVQCKGVSKSEESDIGTSVEVDALRVQISDYESRLSHMDMIIHEKNRELHKYQQDSDVFEDPSKMKAMQTLVDMKETKIASLERIIHELEDELGVLRQESSISSAQRQEELKQLEAYKSHTNFMKAKIDMLKSDLQKKETEMVAVQTKLDTLNNQQSDNRQHIDVLKESLTAKEQRAGILQSEVDSLRGRLDEKQEILDQKQEQLSRLQEDKSTSGTELSHLHDTLDVKDRKIAVLHKKIESLAEVVRERDRLIEENAERLSSMEKDTSESDSALTIMEEALSEKESTIEQLRDDIANIEGNSRVDIEKLRKERLTLEKRLEAVEHDFNDKNTSLTEVQERATSLASAALKKDSRIKHLEISMQQKTEEITRLENQLKKTLEEVEVANAQQAALDTKNREENKKKLEALEKVVKEQTEEATKNQGDLDRLLGILKETENEKHDKDKKISTLEKQTCDLNNKLKALDTQMVEAVKKKGASLDKDMSQLLLQIKNKEERIEELEEALRESVKITAEREMVLAREEEGRHKIDKQMEELMREFEQTKNVLSSTGGRLASTEASLHEKERYIQKMKIERRKLLEETFEIKQEALLAALSEKDANIALLELSQTRKKTNMEEVCILRREKDELMKELRQQTQNRLKLIQDDDEDSQSNKSRGNERAKPSADQADVGGNGIWA